MRYLGSCDTCPRRGRALVAALTLAGLAWSITTGADAQGSRVGGAQGSQQTSPADSDVSVEFFDNVPVLGAISALAEDRDGFVWIAGNDGLARWAGTASTVFRAGASSDQSLPRFGVTSVVADSVNGVWAAAGELVHADGWTETITRTGIPADVLAAYGTDVWALGGAQLTRFDTGTGEPGVQVELSQVALGRVLPELAVAADGTAYVAAELGLWTVSPTGTVELYGAVPGAIRGLSPRSGGGVYVATDEGVWVADGSSTRQPRRIGSARPVTAVLERADGSIWATSEEGTIIVSSAAGELERRVTIAPAGRGTSDIVSPPMRLLFEDRLGELWMATDRTIARYAVPEPEPLQILPPGASADTQVTAVAEEADGLWLALATGAVWRHDDSTDEWEQIEPRQGTLPDDVLIVGLAPTPGGVWVATARNGLWRYDGPRSSWVRVISLDAVALLDATPDSAGGAWVAVADDGLIHLDAAGRIVDGETIDGFDNSHVVVPRADGVWVGGEGGLIRYPPDGGPPTRWSSGEASLRGEVVYDIAFTGGPGDASSGVGTEAEASQVFLATNAGLESIDLGSGELGFHGADQGVPQAQIHEILPHPTRDALWLATSGATLHLFDIGSETVTRSLPATTSSTSLHYGDGDSVESLLFITDGVLVAASPSLGEQLPGRRPVFVSSVLVDGIPSGAASEVDVPLGSTFEAEFLAPSYQPRELQRIWYRLVGVDSTWRQAVEVNRSSVYARLGPGSYDFVVATNPAPDPSDPAVARMTVHVRLAFWQHVWFWPLVVAAAIVAVAAVAARRQRNARARERRLETVVADRTEELGRLAIESQQANESKTRFLSLISHDLRSPLSAVIGSAELIEHHVSINRHDLDGIETDKVIRWAQQASHAGVHLNGMIDDLITVARNSRPVGDHRQMVRIDEFLASIVDMIALAEHQQAPIELVVDPSLDKHYLFDTQRVRQMLVNLTTNGVRHGDGGTVTLEARRVGDIDGAATQHRHRAEFSVASNGQTIPSADLDRIFEPFFRGSGSASSGLGLGLAVVVQLAEMLHTKIEATSSDAGLTRFSFELDLPLAVVPRVDVPSNGAESRPVRVVDDEPSSRQLVSDILVHAGYVAIPASSGQDALSLVDQFNPIIVITDQLMPEMTGLQLATELRRRRGDTLPIIAVTAVSESVGDSAMFDCVLPKPLRQRDLLRRIESLTGERVT